MKKFLFLIILFSVSLIVGAQSVSQRALFIGNSYTYYNDLPQLVADIALSKGDTLTFDSNTPGGYTLQQHSTNATTLGKIGAGSWDYVVFQEQSQRPSFHPAQVAQDVLPYAQTLCNAVRAADSCATPIFYMTWGRKNGDASNCPFYTPLCTYSGMQNRLRSSYLLMGQQNNAEVSPVGAVWREVRALHPGIELYSPDESHPSLAGSYLAACTFYASMFHKSPVGGWRPSGLDSATAANLQQASLLVFDSLNTWMIDTLKPVPHYTYSLDTVASTYCVWGFDFSGSANTDSVYVDFGNGRAYSTFRFSVRFYINGLHPFRAELYQGCKKRVYDGEVYLQCTNSIDEHDSYWSLYPNPVNDRLYVKRSDGNEQPARYRIVALSGSVLMEGDISGYGISTTALPVGVYLLEIISGDQTAIRRFTRVGN